MNGDANGTVSEPMNTDQPSEEDNTSDSKLIESLANSITTDNKDNTKIHQDDLLKIQNDTLKNSNNNNGTNNDLSEDTSENAVKSSSMDDPLKEALNVNTNNELIMQEIKSSNIDDSSKDSLNDNTHVESIMQAIKPSDMDDSVRESNNENTIDEVSMQKLKPSNIDDPLEVSHDDNTNDEVIMQKLKSNNTNDSMRDSNNDDINDEVIMQKLKPSNIDDPLEVSNDELNLQKFKPSNTNDSLRDSSNDDTNDESIMHKINLSNTDGPQDDSHHDNINNKTIKLEFKPNNIVDPLEDLHNDDTKDESIVPGDYKKITSSGIKSEIKNDFNNDIANSETTLDETNVSYKKPLLLKHEQNNSLESNQSSNDSRDCREDPVGDSTFNIDTVKIEKCFEDQIYPSEDEGLKTETFKIVSIIKQDSDEVESIHTSDFSGSEEEHRAEDTVSINSDSDDLVQGEISLKSNEIIILDNEGTDNLNGTGTLEVHEITSDNDNDNDDCVMTSEQKTNTKSSKKPATPQKSYVELRRSSRSIKKKKYDFDLDMFDEDADIEEVILEDPLKRKLPKNIVLNNTKSIIDMRPKKATNNQKKDSITFNDSQIPAKNRTVNKTTNSALNQSIYQRIVSRGISVTPVSSKTIATQSVQASAPPSQPLLPTLTDDMFVVEAPSFIIPYVYEKPAKIPFKEFVDNWRKEIEEEKAKEEQALLEKKKEEKAKRAQERQEKKDKGEDVQDSDEDIESEEVKKRKAEKAEKKEKRRRKKEDDDISWDGSSSESEDETSSEEEGHITILKEKAEVMDEIKDVTDVNAETTGKSDSYFDLFLGKFFMNIGMNLVQEYVQTDLLKQRQRKLQREKKAGHDITSKQMSVTLLTKNLEASKKVNAPFAFEIKKCEFCTFKTESALMMAHHLETPHMKNNLYKCNYCPFEIRSPHDILFHMETAHAVKGKLERTQAHHQCANCPFEDHGKAKLARHLVACAKKFKPESNLAPPIEWEHPAKIAKIPRARNSNPSSYQVAQFGRHHVDGTTYPRTPIPIMNAMPAPYRPRNRTPIPRQPLPLPMQARPSGVVIRQCLPNMQTNYHGGTSKKSTSSISITPLPRQLTPVPVPSQHVANAKGFVICEICDGYIKDLEQLRNHMQWIHKVKIHPKMIYNRPPLNCQKCQFRFFTDQGLERHLLGSHGLVTSSMQEAANKGKDAGRCPVCGRVYQWKLLNHVSREHNLVLKPAHLSYKCTVCTATFGMYRQFENHVYSAHSVVANKVMDKKANAATAKAVANDNAAKQLKINDEITIIPQPMKTPAAKGK